VAAPCQGNYAATRACSNIRAFRRSSTTIAEVWYFREVIGCRRAVASPGLPRRLFHRGSSSPSANGPRSRSAQALLDRYRAACYWGWRNVAACRQERIAHLADDRGCRGGEQAARSRKIDQRASGWTPAGCSKGGSGASPAGGPAKLTSHRSRYSETPPPGRRTHVPVGIFG
jgi:hypothetical protein